MRRSNELALIDPGVDVEIDPDAEVEPDADAPEGGPGLLPPVGMGLKDALRDYEKRVIIEALREAEGVQARAARRLGISRSNLNYRIGRLDIQLTGLDYQ